MSDINETIKKEISTFALNADEYNITMQAIDHSIDIEENPNYQESVVLNSPSSGQSSSYKHAYKFNLTNVFESIGTLMINLTSVTISPWLGLVGFLIFLKQVKAATSVKLSKDTCKVLWGICHIQAGNEYKDKTQNLQDIVFVTNSELDKYKKSPMTEAEIKEELDELADIGIIVKLNETQFEVNTKIKVFKKV